MKIALLSLFLVIAGSVFAQSFDERNTTISNVAVNVTNIGTFGNAFRGYRDGSGTKSCEYPVQSGIEHLFESGIWFGGIVNGQTLVSTSAYDAPSGYATGRAGFEFTNKSGDLQYRSSFFDSPFFTPDAISHEDLVSVYTDENILIPGTQIQIQGHTNPMFVDVRGEVYNWSYSFSDFFVILNFYIVNNSQNLIDSAYFALWANTVIRNINVTPAGSGGSAFYNKGGNGYLDSLFMAYCFDADGDVGFTDTYIGQKFLGAEDKNGFQHPLLDPTKRFKSHYSTWQFNNSTDPIFFLPQNEVQRYQRMTAGLNYNQCWDQNSTQNPNCNALSLRENINQAGNRADLVSLGPFRDFQPGDTINITYAFVLAPKNEDGNPNSENNEVQRTFFVQNAAWAQTAYNGEDKNFNGILDPGEDLDGNGRITRYILPAPPDRPRIRVEAGDHRIDVYWSNNAEASVDPITQELDFEGYRVYLSKLGFDVLQTPPKLEFVKVGEYDIKGNNLFNEVGFDQVTLPEPITFDGDTNIYYYRYTLENIQNGWQYAIAVTAFDRGNPGANLESLESNPNSTNRRVFAGTRVNDNPEENGPFVYPNPYYAGASWEGKSSFQEESRKIYFANLPERCKIRVYTTAGDFIKEIYHDQDYNGSDIRWFRTFGAVDPDNNVFSGGEHAWNLLSEDSQILARGLYVFSVEDLETGKLYKGKFLIIK